MNIHVIRSPERIQHTSIVRTSKYESISSTCEKFSSSAHCLHSTDGSMLPVTASLTTLHATRTETHQDSNVPKHNRAVVKLKLLLIYMLTKAGKIYVSQFSSVYSSISPTCIRFSLDENVEKSESKHDAQPRVIAISWGSGTHLN